MLKEIKPGNFIIVYDLSRFCRDQKDAIDNFRDLVRNKGCTFISLNPELDSRDSNSDFMVGIYSTLNEKESRRISERVTANMGRLSLEGRLLTRPPFGYVRDPASRKYIPDPEQQEIVKKLETWYLTGVNVNEMTKRLNDEGLGHVLNNNKVNKNDDAKFSHVTVGSIVRGYGIIKDSKTPTYTYPERVEKWNNAPHRSKKKKQAAEADED